MKETIKSFLSILKKAARDFDTSREKDFQFFLKPIQHFEWLQLFLQIFGTISNFFCSFSKYVYNLTIYFACNDLIIPNCRAILITWGYFTFSLI